MMTWREVELVVWPCLAAISSQRHGATRARDHRPGRGQVGQGVGVEADKGAGMESGQGGLPSCSIVVVL